MSVSILGGGAFGTALAIALSRDGDPVSLWTRDDGDARRMQSTRQSGQRLPGFELPDAMTVCSEIPYTEICLIAVPAQKVDAFLRENADRLADRVLITCAKGIDRRTGLAAVDVVKAAVPEARAGCLTGPSFAVDIADGLPTALVLALDGSGEDIQRALTRPALRIYRTTDVMGAQLGGALKNVVALAAGVAIGAGLGDSARASVIARGFAEMKRYAEAKGAKAETLQGLSGLGDLVLTCTSPKSRNFAAGIAFGKGDAPDEATTVEGIATADALAKDAEASGIDMPLTRAVCAVTQGHHDIETAIDALLARPVGEE